MPMHDWSRIDPNLYHHFHKCWTIAICDVLNSRLLPSGYSALIASHGELQANQPDAGDAETVLAAKGNRVAIHHGFGEIVCVIEVVSPGNKHSKLAFTQFVEKALAFLDHGVHLLIIDPFPPSKRDPTGIHNAIWQEIDESPTGFQPDKPLTLAAYVAGDVIAGLETMAFVEPIAVGDRLPDMPAYLEWGEYVPVPLESTYQAAWANCPADMRELVEKGKPPE